MESYLGIKNKILEEWTQAQKSATKLDVDIIFVPNRTSTSTSATRTSQYCAEMQQPSCYRKEEKAGRNTSANKSLTAAVNVTGFSIFV